MHLNNKIGLIGDVHAEDKALKKVLNFFKESKIKSLLCTGDICDGYGDINKTIELLIAHNVHCVQGNHDEWIIADILRDIEPVQQFKELNFLSQKFIKNLPVNLEFETSFGKLLLYHGLGLNNMLRLKPDTNIQELLEFKEMQDILNSAHKFCIGGHTHRKMVRPFHHKIFINAGTLNREYEQCFSIIDLEQKIIQFYNLEFECTTQFNLDI